MGFATGYVPDLDLITREVDSSLSYLVCVFQPRVQPPFFQWETLWSRPCSSGDQLEARLQLRPLSSAYFPPQEESLSLGWHSG